MIYLDNTATVKQSQSSLEIMLSYASENFFNPSSLYGVKNLTNLENTRQLFLQKMGNPAGSTFVFTSGATEANNMVLNSVSDNIIISAAEHDSIYNFAKHLLNLGKNIKICPLQKNGEIDYQVLHDLIDDKTKLVSIVHVCNETGVVNDLVKISEIIKSKNPKTLFHSDGVQAFGKLSCDCNSLGVDFYTVSAHKIAGPKGVGGVWAKNKNKLKPLIFGGGQEGEFRSGTENLPAIMAFAHNLESYKPDKNYVCDLKSLFVEQLTESGIQINFANSSCYILSILCNNINGETIVNELKNQEIYISRGSACSSKKAGNRIFESMGFSREKTKSLLRISFFETNTKDEVIYAAKQLNQIYKDLKERVNLK
jgi:cysteine desulfurase